MIDVVIPTTANTVETPNPNDPTATFPLLQPPEYGYLIENENTEWKNHGENLFKTKIWINDEVVMPSCSSELEIGRVLGMIVMFFLLLLEKPRQSERSRDPNNLFPQSVWIWESRLYQLNENTKKYKLFILHLTWITIALIIIKSFSSKIHHLSYHTIIIEIVDLCCHIISCFQRVLKNYVVFLFHVTYNDIRFFRQTVCNKRTPHLVGSFCNFEGFYLHWAFRVFQNDLKSSSDGIRQWELKLVEI